MSITEIEVSELYKRYLGREPDAYGLENTLLYNDVVDAEHAIYNSNEFIGKDILLCTPRNNELIWKAVVLHEAKMIFIPIAKNAHTSILSCFLDFMSISHSQEDVHETLYRQKTGLLFKDHSPFLLSEILKDKEYIVATVVRDPIDRLMSAYNYFFIQERMSYPHFVHSKQIFEHFVLDGETLSFDNLPEIGIGEFIKVISSQTPGSLDPHWRPQFEYLRSLKVDCIIPMEKLYILEELIFSRSGKRLKLSHINSRNQTALSAEALINETQRKIIEDYYWIDRMLYENAKVSI